MWNTPEQRAWAIVLVGFVIFCVLIVAVPLSVRWYLINDTVAPHTALKPIEAAVRVRTPKEKEFLAVTQDRNDLVEGTVIATDEYSRCFVRFFENSTLTLYNDTEIALVRVRSPRFGISPKSNDMVIQVKRGRVAIGVASPAPPDERILNIVIQTPHARVTLEEGGYSLLVSDAETQITARLGKAVITTADDKATCRNGRCRVTPGSPIEGPLPPEQNLIVNGEFTSVLGSGWADAVVTRDDETDPWGEAKIVAIDGRTVLSFVRSGARTHGELSTMQRIDKDVRDFASLKFSCEVRVSHQSLPGGGFQSTEFPIMIELTYKDAFGDTRARYWGFYYLPPDMKAGWRPLVNGLQVVQGEWYVFESQNLIELLGDLAPVYIESVRIYASGWDFESAITNISLQITE
ncbi:MAG: hypothetical protein JW934_23035 [Anaerolineae bacterium]|nr:hypothetical protein [Anaerolineae bacterium]